MQASSSSSPDDVSAAAAVPPWLDLPDPCLLGVLRCCATAGLRTLFSAARAHSRLQQAAALVLDSMNAKVGQQEQMDSLQLYLSRHGQHVHSISLDGLQLSETLKGMRPVAALRKLPVNLQRLRTVSFAGIRLQLQPGSGHMGALPQAVGAHLTRLELRGCELLDGEEGLVAALKQLPGLQHLSTCHNYNSKGITMGRFSGVLAAASPNGTLQQVTYLELASRPLRPERVHIAESPTGSASALQHLTALTCLADLRLALGLTTVTAGTLAGAEHLTRLQLRHCGGLMGVEPAVLAGVPQLQHLEIQCGLYPDTSAATAELLHQLQHLQQLTALVITRFPRPEPDSPAATAYSALTASSKLRRLSIVYCPLPADAWQHVLPAGRQLPHLTALFVSGEGGTRGTLSVPDGSRLVSCCPGLHSLTLGDFPRHADIVALAQHPRLRELGVLGTDGRGDARLLQLTCLTQLTRLESGSGRPWTLKSQAPGDEPVWCQLMRHYLNHSDSEVARQAAAGLPLNACRWQQL